jgi:hypothetical protein
MRPIKIKDKTLLVPEKEHEIELAKDHMKSELAVALFRTIRNFESDSYHLEFTDPDIEATLLSMFEGMHSKKHSRKKS